VAEFGKAWRNRNRSWGKSLGIFCTSSSHNILVGFLLCDFGGYKCMNTHITFLAIHPNFQMYGLGSYILQTFLKSEMEARRSVSLTPTYVDHVWKWYHKQGFRVTRYSKADDGGVFTLMNFHPYPTRSHNTALKMCSVERSV
jgi:ribosomal protein S18 acetylase RimI-like enzyme